MGVEGELVGMSMVSLVQAMCLERRKAALFLRRADEEGALFFDDGEIVHATSGPLVGEAAVHELVTWTEGSFRLKDYDILPRRTVAPGWNRHLLEGLRRMDERDPSGGAHEPAASLSAEQVGHDQRLEDVLIVLLSKIEQLASGEYARRKSPTPEGRVAVLKGVVSALGEAIEALAVRQGTRVEFLMTLSEIHALVDASPNATQDPGAVGAEVWLRGAMRKYFTLAVGQFYSHSARDRWIDTADVFLTDLFGKLGSLALR